MIDSKEIDKAMDAVEKVIFNHSKAWAIESAYNQYLADEYKFDGMPHGIVRSLLLAGAAASLACRLKAVAESAFQPKSKKENKAKRVYIKGIEPDCGYSGAALFDAINKELQC